LVGLLVATTMAADAGAAPGDGVGGGRNRPGAQVVGGRPVRQGAYPFIAAVLDTARGRRPMDEPVCGGTLIDPDRVLSASHLVDEVGHAGGPKLRNPRVAVSRTTLSSHQGQERRVTRVEIHPRYRRNGVAFDAAVLTLDQPATGITPIALADSGGGLDRPGRRGILAGWGITRPQPATGEGRGANDPSRMQRAEIPILPVARCADAHRGGSRADDSARSPMVCAGRENLDACQGRQRRSPLRRHRRRLPPGRDRRLRRRLRRPRLPRRLDPGRRPVDPQVRRARRPRPTGPGGNRSPPVVVLKGETVPTGDGTAARGTRRSRG